MKVLTETAVVAVAAGKVACGETWITLAAGTVEGARPHTVNGGEQDMRRTEELVYLMRCQKRCCGDH